MKKRGMSTLFLVILAIVIIAIVGIVYYYTTEEKVELTPEEQKPLPEEQQTVKPEQKTLELTSEELERAKAIGLTQEEAKTAKSLDLTPKEFKEVSTKAEEVFKENEPLLYNERALKYSKIQEESIGDYGVGGIKPDSKIIQVQFVGIQPPPYIIYLIKNGEVKIIAEDLEPKGL